MLHYGKDDASNIQLLIYPYMTGNSKLIKGGSFQAKSLFIVGNSDVQHNYSTIIDASDFVIRFNNMSCLNKTVGLKTNVWVISSNKFLLANQINKYKEAGKTKLAEIHNLIVHTDRLIFPIPPNILPKRKVEDSVNQSQENDLRDREIAVYDFLNFFGVINHPFSIISFPYSYTEDLNPSRWKAEWIMPSNGYLMTRMVLEDPTFISYTKTLVGFSWEGWSGHPWSIERSYLQQLNRTEQIEILS